MRSLALAFTVAALAGCPETKNPYEQKPPPAPKPVKMLGVDPAKFDCTAFLSEAEVASAVGSPVTYHGADMPGPEGVPNPCIYAAPVPPEPDAAPPRRIDAGPGPAPKVWQVALDCRARAVGEATGIMDQMASQAGSTTPQVGKRAVDHDDARLITVDDDTTCAIYVSGPDAKAREALARATVTKLNEANMPTRPHAVPVK